MVVATKSSEAFELLEKTLRRALSDRDAFDRKLHLSGTAVENFDQVVTLILTDYLPGSAFPRGGSFIVNAGEPYSQLNDAEKSAVKDLYVDLVATGRWKLVPPVQWVGPGALDSNKLKEVARFRFNIQYGGFKRSAFLDVPPETVEEIRKEIAAYRPASATETVPNELRDRVGTAVQQMLNGGISPKHDKIINWKK